MRVGKTGSNSERFTGLPSALANAATAMETTTFSSEVRRVVAKTKMMSQLFYLTAWTHLSTSCAGTAKPTPMRWMNDAGRRRR